MGMMKMLQRLKHQKELLEWFDKHNEGGHDFTKPPTREMVKAAFPDCTEEQIDYYIRKPNRIFERFEE